MSWGKGDRESKTSGEKREKTLGPLGIKVETCSQRMKERN